MVRSHDQLLTLRQAARLIYNTSSPSAAQVAHVLQAIRAGHLRGEPQGRQRRWMTTPTDVAEYLTRQSLAQASKTARDSAGPAAARRGQRLLLDVYSDLLRDYFHALLLRRYRRNASRAFRNAVAVSRAVLLAGFLIVSYLAVRPWFAGLAPEQQAVVQWLQTHQPQHQILRWLPAEQPATQSPQRVPVEYRYFPGGRSVVTRRVFLVRDGKVVGQAHED